MAAPYEGGCACGAIRYRLRDEPLTFYVCHCTDCQKQTSTAFNLSMPVAREADASRAREASHVLAECMRRHCFP